MFLKLRKRTIWLLVKKELSYYFNNPFGYIAAAIFGVFANFLFMKDVFLVSDGSMRQFFELLIWLLLIFVPVVGMRLFSEEKRLRTIEVLFSLPVTIGEVIAAKFLSLILFCFIALCLTFTIPITLIFISSPHIPTIIVSYFGVMMLTMLMGSITLFFSSRTASQIVAFLCSLTTTFLLLVIGSDFIGTSLPSSIRNILALASPLNYLDAFYKGIIDVRSIVFYTSLTLLFLIFTHLSIRKTAT